VTRCVMGLGAAMAFPATLSLISNVFTERRERARAIGLWGAITGAAIALGPIVGGWLLQAFDWTSTFFAMALVAALAAGLVARYVPTSRDPDAARTDRGGFALRGGDGGPDLHDHASTEPRLGQHGPGSASQMGPGRPAKWARVGQRNAPGSASEMRPGRPAKWAKSCTPPGFAGGAWARAR
jgi:MFS family permease